MVKNNLLFGGVSAAAFGVYISGEGVYNAPERAVEMVTVPGRNGALAIDQGRYENVVVEYPAFVRARSQKEMRKKLSAFKNAIVSQIGYQRIEDTYHPEEYRMGVYLSGLDVEPVLYGTAAKFTLAFNCKPQRFLKSGEEELSVSSGDVLTNPTPFESKPLLAVWGSGGVSIGEDSVYAGSEPIGEIELLEGKYWYPSRSSPGEFPPLQLNEPFPSGDLREGDEIVMDKGYSHEYMYFLWQYYVGEEQERFPFIDDSQYGETMASWGNQYTDGFTDRRYAWFCLATTQQPTFHKGTDWEITESINYGDHVGDGHTYTFTYTIGYDASTSSFYWNVVPGGPEQTPGCIEGLIHASYDKIIGHSTKPFGEPIYIDCDTGEAYMIGSDGVVINANQYAAIGTDLPTLHPGETEISCDNTVTDLRITPRWWKI